MNKESLSVVIPVYRSEATLPELIARLYPVLRDWGAPFEIILVNDGSPDHSWDTITRLMAQWPQVRGIDLSRNYGQHNALLCGIRAAEHDIVITMDDDLQNPPEEIPLLLHKLREGPDVVYGTPVQEQHGWWRDRASVLVKRILSHIMGVPTARYVSAFRAFRTHVREAFLDYRSSFVSIDALLSWGTTRFAAVPVRHHPRGQGRSNYTWRKLVAHALNLTTSFSTLPLHLAGLLGALVTLGGLALLSTVIVRYFLEGSKVPGFPFLVSVITIFSGTQLFVLGIIGEYLARIHFRLMERPVYSIRSTTLPLGASAWKEPTCAATCPGIAPSSAGVSPVSKAAG
jgi:undecaprenyl-phosphate 4-deoxy-4-formamido-L-arabinose transferase